MRTALKYAAFAIGLYSLFVMRETAINRHILSKANKVIISKGDVVKNEYETYHVLRIGNVSFYSQKERMAVKILQKEGDEYGPRQHLTLLIDESKNGSIDRVVDRYFPNNDITTEEVNYIGVDLFPFHEHQTEYITLLRLLSEEKFSLIKARYLPRIRLPGIYQV